MEEFSRRIRMRSRTVPDFLSRVEQLGVLFLVNKFRRNWKKGGPHVLRSFLLNCPRTSLERKLMSMRGLESTQTVSRQRVADKIDI